MLIWTLMLQFFYLSGQDVSTDKQLPADSLLELAQYYNQVFLLDSTILFYELAAKELLKEPDTVAYLLTKVNIANVYSIKSDFEKAYSILDSVFRVVRDKPDSRPRFEVLKFKSFLLISQRNFETALSCLDSADMFNFQRETKEGLMRQARVSLLKAFSNVQLNRLTTGEELFETSRHIYDSLQMDLELAEVLGQLGVVKVQLFKADEAISYLNRAKEIYERYSGVDPTTLASMHNSMGQAYEYLGLMPNAVSSFKKADELLNLVDPSYLDLAVVNIRLAEAYIAMGDFEKALIAVEKGLILSNQHYGERNHWTLTARFNLGKILHELSQYDEAIEVITEGITLLQGDSSDEAMDLLSFFIYERGAIYFDMGKEKEGLKRMKASVPVSIQSGANFERSTIEIYQGLAETYFSLNEPDSAAAYFQRALSLSDKRTGNSVSNALVAYHDRVYESLIGKSRSFEMKYNADNNRQWLDSAYQMLMAAEEKMGSFREFPNSFAKKLEVGSNISSSLQTGVNICYQLFKLTGDESYADHAYTLVEKSKSNQALFNFPLEQLTPGNVPDSVIFYEKNLNASISSVETLLYQELQQETPNEGNVASYEEQIVELTDKLLLLKYEIDEKYPAYFQLKYNREYLSISETQSQLISDNDRLINYHYQDNEIFIFELGKTTFEFLQVPISEDFESVVKSLIKALNQPDVSAGALAEYERLSSQLGRQLLPTISTLKPESSLIIIPDGPLHLIPFEVLTKGQVSGAGSFSSLDYLIKDHPIRYGTSATMLAYQQKNEYAGTGLVAFAPSFSKNENSAFSETDTVRAALGNLIHSKREVESIEKYFETKLFLDTAATERAFRSNVANHSIVHLASHALVNQENSLFSKLLFSPFNTDSINDGSLNTREILGMNIPANMVVLSACNTGSGDLLPGEGVMSLANGFFYAGARSLVMTLWPANDESTSEIMDSFYENLSLHDTKSHALRKAKLSHLESANPLSAHPYYWAHFIVNGDDAPLVENKTSLYFWVIMAALLLVVFVLFTRKILASK